MMSREKQIESEWIVTTKTDADYYTPSKVAICKHCGEELWFKGKVRFIKFCPHCGAKMKGGAE